MGSPGLPLQETASCRVGCLCRTGSPRGMLPPQLCHQQPCSVTTHTPEPAPRIRGMGGGEAETAEPHLGGTAEGHLSLNLHLGRGGPVSPQLSAPSPTAAGMVSGPNTKNAGPRDAMRREAPVTKASVLPTPGGTAPRYPTCQQGAPCPLAGPGPSAAWHGGDTAAQPVRGRRPAPGLPTPPAALGSSCGRGSTQGVHS